MSYVKPPNISTTLDVKKCREEVIGTARRLLKEKVETIVLGCTGFSTAGIAHLIQEELGVPVVDPLVATGTLMYHELIRLYVLREVFR